jgi:hypothetical protein
MYAQVNSFQDSTITNNNPATKQNTPFFNYNKLHFSMNFGAGYIGGSNLYSGAYTSLSPSLNYQVTPRLNIQTGVTLVSGLNNFSPASNPSAQSNFFQGPNQFSFYASGQYLLTKNLSLVGSAYKTVNTNNSEKLNPLFQNFQGMNIGLNYKITDHMSIGTSLNITNNPYNLLNQNVMGGYSPFLYPTW